MTERKPNLRPVRELTPSLQFRTIHGYRRAFRVAGSGPAILLIHGIGDNSTTWSTVQPKLAQRFTVIAPDLLGHGKSDKPRADYSVARLRQRHAGPAERAGHRPRHGDRALAGRRGGHAVRLPVPATGRPADPGRRRRGDQGRQHRAALGLPADTGQRGTRLAAGAAGAARPAGGRAGSPARCWVPRAWAATCPTCCAFWPTCPSRPRRRHSPGHCAPWWTGAVKSSPCWTDVI